MSVEVSNWVWEHSKASGNDLIVLLKIADNANADGGGAYPGVDYLARAGRISKRAVYDCLRRLKASGELAEEEGGGGRGRKTTYRVLMGNGAEAAPITDEGNGAASRAETVQPAALNGADSGSAYKEEPSLNRPKNRRVEPTARPDVEDLCQKLAERIIANGGSPAKYRDKATKQAWTEPMRLLLDRDLAEHNGTAADRVAKAIDWCQSDDFWRSVVLSPAKLREQYDALRLAAQRQPTGNGRPKETSADHDARVEATLRDLDSAPPLAGASPEEWAAYYARFETGQVSA